MVKFKEKEKIPSDRLAALGDKRGPGGDRGGEMPTFIFYKD